MALQSQLTDASLHSSLSDVYWISGETNQTFQGANGVWCTSMQFYAGVTVTSGNGKLRPVATSHRIGLTVSSDVLLFKVFLPTSCFHAGSD